VQTGIYLFPLSLEGRGQGEGEILNFSSKKAGLLKLMSNIEKSILRIRGDILLL
jgi:hypothetical protein